MINIKKRLIRLLNPALALVLGILLIPLHSFAQESSGELQITRTATMTSAPIPIHVSGLAGEAFKILKFDLEISGCDLVSSEKALYIAQASSDSGITGKLTDQTGEITFFHRSYKNGTDRALVHAYAADIIKVITGQDAIFNQKIAYCINTDLDKNEIFISDFDGHNPQQVTRDGSLIRALTWGPDKSSLFYCSYRALNPDIYKQELYTGKRTIIANYLGLNTSPSVSPDGTQIAMIISRSGSPDLYVADIDGSNLKRLTKTQADESSPCWSPDGKYICYSSRASGSAKLYIISPDGGTPKRIITSGVGSATEPNWSPDGKYIAFTTTTRRSFQICIVPAEGGMVEVLAEGEAPCWAPNSRTLIFHRKKDKKSSLVMLDVPTKKTKTITSIAGNASQAFWSR